jgi:hypothetical protein
MIQESFKLLVQLSIAQPFYNRTLNIVEVMAAHQPHFAYSGGGGDGCVNFRFHLVHLVCPTIIKKMKTKTEQKTR